MAVPGLDLDAFKLRSVMPADYLDAIEQVAEGWLLQRIDTQYAWVCARLTKRYNVPFTAPVPEIVLGWLVTLVTWDAWQRRGYDPADLSMVQAKDDADAAKLEIKEAADSKDGLFELPLRQDTTQSGAVRQGPRAYTENSPYVWTDQQAAEAYDEDVNGEGTFRG